MIETALEDGTQAALRTVGVKVNGGKLLRMRAAARRERDTNQGVSFSSMCVLHDLCDVCNGCRSEHALLRAWPRDSSP